MYGTITRNLTITCLQHRSPYHSNHILKLFHSLNFVTLPILAIILPVRRRLLRFKHNWMKGRKRCIMHMRPNPITITITISPTPTLPLTTPHIEPDTYPDPDPNPDPDPDPDPDLNPDPYRDPEPDHYRDPAWPWT